MPEYLLDPNLRPYATDRQWELLEALAEHGSLRKAATALGCHNRLIFQAKKAVNQRAAKMGYSPDHDMTRPVPDGFKLRGVSTYYGHDGKMRGQWVKSAEDRERQFEILRDAVSHMSSDIKRALPVAPPKVTAENLCNLYTITDYHMGMLAWHKEGGHDWDIRIASDTLNGCFAAMIDGAPKAKYCVVSQLGDFLHFDGLMPVTPTGGHIVDADSRFSKMVGAALDALRMLIDMALARHEQVHVIMAEGNHDIASSVWLRHLFSALYENERRVTVDLSELPYYVYQHGETMLAFHHGHLKKPDMLPTMFSAQFPKVWGATTKRYGHSGHQHHVYIKEQYGMTVTQHPTLAARDAYASRGGWHADRQALCITYHKKFGQVASNHITPEMLA